MRYMRISYEELLALPASYVQVISDLARKEASERKAKRR